MQIGVADAAFPQLMDLLVCTLRPQLTQQKPDDLERIMEEQMNYW